MLELKEKLVDWQLKVRREWFLRKFMIKLWAVKRALWLINFRYVLMKGQHQWLIISGNVLFWSNELFNGTSNALSNYFLILVLAMNSLDIGWECCVRRVAGNVPFKARASTPVILVLVDVEGQVTGFNPIVSSDWGGGGGSTVGCDPKWSDALEVFIASAGSNQFSE